MTDSQATEDLFLTAKVPFAAQGDDGEVVLKDALKGMDLYSLYPQRLLNLSDEWQWFIAESLDGEPKLTKIVGAIAPKFLRGKRMGHRNWSKRDKSTERTVYFTQEQFLKFRRDLEIETGKCTACSGHGMELRGWKSGVGFRYRTCKRCVGTGVAP